MTHDASPQILNELSRQFETATPQEILAHALKTYNEQIILACSFGAEDVALLDMMLRINPQTPLFYLDTDFLFSETYDIRDRLIQKYGLRPDQVRQMKPLSTPDEQTQHHGPNLWLRDPDQCCALRKIEPLSRVLKDYTAWITGIRRDQAPTRANAGLVEWDTKFKLVKFNPLANWTTDDVWTYIRASDVPYNHIHDQHYPSIGCMHCTKPVMPGEDPRSGRWSSSEKTECGLHK